MTQNLSSKNTSSLRARARESGLSCRDALSKEERSLFSQRACRHFLEAFEKKGTDFSRLILAGYWPIKSEIDPRPLLDVIASRGGRLALPAVLDSTTMIFREFSPHTQLQPMRFGTLGPGADNATVIPNNILVPLSAFDHHCHRLGYGGGYYDRAVEALEKQGHQMALWGIGFSCQEVDSIPAAKHDLQVQGIFTEKGFLKC
ncbi:5-formyltetrahydrofolate cyclo-ligase [Bartonella krasnovii]|uniref:5-formyltetrahydrofolate cyclo-ligase n=1 Tax=Bartonella krasnovii TaxID=2267275 RepID=UPI001F4C5AB1|nr:5-formyltetrahydrofolate cyclo-ligase [Bartonella krasnovii]UNF38502.1 5-formyltetrahydrofolate cyclo-ligase [Bartonella krasnovii]UNF41891.1 5-formyltetrahydrofolate cyclo-ligase [Bartonella krasnovii]UNF50038.1 5-formyltetrahydrofolate cyclo-ligase [Bartonella krasnovii]UNF55098.1 5-formyltetrahydrofolate cyclo-ligase [Bartonella krasnovii]